MLIYFRLLSICVLPVCLSGCAGFVKYLEKLQEQSVDDFEQRSVHFQPKFQVEPLKRSSLSPEEQRLVGAPPPQKGEVLLDGVRYYSANGNVCQYFPPDRRDPAASPKSACWVNGRWELAAPILNTELVK